MGENEMEFELKLSTEDIKLLDEALVQLPYAKVFKLIDKLNQQIVEQEQDVKFYKDDDA